MHTPLMVLPMYTCILQEKQLHMGSYCDEIIAAIISIGAGSAVARLDVVFGVFLPLSRKRDTREARGSKSVVRVSVKENTPIVKNTKAFLASESNKMKLFVMIANKLRNVVSETTLVATRLDGVVSNRASLETHQL